MDAGKKRSAAQANLGLANHRPVKRRHQYRKPSIPYQRTPFGLDLAALGVANLAQSAMAFVSKVMGPESPAPEARVENNEDVPGGFPFSKEVLPNDHTEHDEVEEVGYEDEKTPSPARDVSEVPTETQESSDASPVPPTPILSREESMSLLRDTPVNGSTEPSRLTTPTSPRRGAWKKPVLNYRRRAHPLKKQHDLEMKLRTSKELFNLRRAAGYSQDLGTFRSYMSYREHLEAWLAATDKKLPPPPPASGPESLPPLPSVNYLHRAVENARKTFESPRPTIPLFSAAEALARQNRERDEAIERRLRPKLPDSLPPAEEAKVSQSLSNRSFLAKAAREQVSAHDLQRLGPRQWLNDEIINFYGAMISLRAEAFEKRKDAERKAGLEKGTNGLVNGKGKERAKKGDFPDMEGVGDPWKIHVFSTYFLTKLQDMGYERAKLSKWTKKVDIFSKDLVLIPCNLGNSHWTCAAINFRDKRIEYYDSMGIDRPSIRQDIYAYLEKEHQDKKGKPFDFSGWTDFFADNSPQQENGYDCGVFVCQTMENLSRGVPVPFDFTQRNMPYLRRRMILEIANEELSVKRLPYPS